MRHGEALSPQIDPERGLSDNGKLAIQKVATHLQESGVFFNKIFYSKKKRARETAEIMAKTISPNAEIKVHNYIKPEDDPNIILAEINSWTEDTLIASHLPFVPNLMTLLTEKDAYLTAITFETGTIICLEKIKDAWTINWATAPSEI